MTLELTNEEKVTIINSHLKNLAYNKFNIEISVIEENAKSSPDSSNLANLNSQISEIDAQIAALNSELAELSA
jgi:type I restriction-modification system DNA methylase subunit